MTPLLHDRHPCTDTKGVKAHLLEEVDLPSVRVGPYEVGPLVHAWRCRNCGRLEMTDNVIAEVYAAVDRAPAPPPAPPPPRGNPDGPIVILPRTCYRPLEI